MKKLLPQIASLFLVLMPLLGRAQENRVSGQLIDIKTKQPVPFASVSLRNAGTGALSNEQGQFQLAGFAGKQDSIIVMTLGYDRYAAFIENNNAEKLTISLTHRNYENLESSVRFICRRLTDKDIRPIDKIEQIKTTPGTQYAFFIGNEKRKNIGELKAVSFYIGENGFPMQPFRIRLYKADGTAHAPSSDLMNGQVFITAEQGGEWYTWDLSTLNISVPNEGCFVGMEFGNPTNHVSQPALPQYSPSGFIMRPAFEIKKSEVWRLTEDKGWYLLPPSGLSRRYNAMVKIEVEELK